MRKIKKYSTKNFNIKFNKWDLNPISFTRACNIPHEACIPFDIDKFNYEYEKQHGLLNVVAEDIESYSYS